MKIYLSAFADEASKDFAGQLCALRDNNIKYIELRKINGTNISGVTVDEAREYKKMLDTAGIKVWSLGSPLAKQFYFKDLNAEIKMAEHLCELAEIFACDNIRAFSFITPFRKRNSETVKAKLKDIFCILEEHKINYCLENDTGLYADIPERISEILDFIPGMKYVYDPANFIVSGCNSSDTLDKLCKTAYYFHIKDAKGKLIVPCGQGYADIDRLVKMLDRDCVCTVEPHLFAYRDTGGVYGDRYALNTTRGKFDLAVDAFKAILENNGYIEKNGYFEKTES